MNCRQTRFLVSAYLDQELTGREMLDIHAHIQHCAMCAQEWREISEVRRLLRALPLYTPPHGAEQRLSERLARPEESLWTTLTAGLTSASVASSRPRSRRLAAALALSSLVILAMAAPGPPPLGDAASPGAGAITALPPMQASLLPLTTESWVGGLFPAIRLTSTTTPPPQDAPTDFSMGAAEPLRDQTAVDYVQGNVALADYRADSLGAR